ncbi:telomerase reverse transcriptase-like isoform X2 [Vespa velutina]|uniref:telomerase reverse transcriptase-like isoform X2 n=1 Tax=Vespa velutina TaxID=202808 RepID=UPI001FB53644|nr:telomerase reverse transcriptase-like isoform X2 [Vespa velutina]
MTIIRNTRKMECIWNELEKFYGSQVATYCKNKNLILEKIKCGAIKLHNCTDLMECSRILQDEKEQPLFSDFLASQFGISKLPSKKTLSNERKIKEENNPYLRNINLKVVLKEKSNFISTKPVSNNCILDTALFVRDIYNDIIKIKVNRFDDAEVDQNYSNQLMFILKNFQKKHKNYSYNFHLNNILEKKNTRGYYGTLTQSWKQIDEIEIDIKKINYFFNNILIKVVPLELFGSYKNIEVIRKLIYCILKSARFQPIYLKSYINRLNIDKIEWLESFKEESVKWLIISKLIYWFINKYILLIVNRNFFVTVHPAAIGKRLYIKNGKWKTIRKHFVKDRINKKVFINVFENKWLSPKSEFRLFLKHSGLRPIAKTSYTSKEEDHMTILLKFLRQLCVTHYGLSSMSQFRDKYKAIVYKRNNYDCNKMWLVSCDIDDAFSSIRLDKLNNIIKILCENLPNKLGLKWMAFLPIKSKTGNLRFEQYFVDLYVALPIGTIHAPTTISMSKTHITHIMKQNLLDDINKCIFGQKIEIKKKKYLLNKGILQGTILSNVFSDIYYNYIYHQRMSEFMQSGILFRYVDDTLYISENRESAEKFMETINKGFPEYNCSFKQSKIQTNLPHKNNYTTNEIKFLGYKINCDSLESLPYFKNAHPSHLFTLAMKNKKCEDATTMFKQRITNHSYLRLSKIILYDPTKCIHRLTVFVKQISIMQAWRALMFIQKLFGDTHKLYTNYQKIFLIIKISNRKIVTAILNHCTEDIQKKSNFNGKKMRQKIFISLWTAYKRIFSNDAVIYKIFVDLIEKEMENRRRYIGKKYMV